MWAGDRFSAATWISLLVDRSQRFQGDLKLTTSPLISVSAEISSIATGKSCRFLNNAGARVLSTPRNPWEFYGPRDKTSPSLTTWALARDTTLIPGIHFLPV